MKYMYTIEYLIYYNHKYLLVFYRYCSANKVVPDMADMADMASMVDTTDVADIADQI